MVNGVVRSVWISEGKEEHGNCDMAAGSCG